MTLHTIADAARLTQRSAQSIRKLSERNGIGRKYGRDWLYTDEDLETIRNWRKPGKPKGAKNKPRPV